MDKKMKEEVNMNLGEKIFNERTKLNLSQEQFAEQMKVSRQAVSKWETGQSLPDLDKLVLMSRIFGVTTDYLLGEDGDTESREEILNNGFADFSEEEIRKDMQPKQHETRYVTDDEAEKYIKTQKRCGKGIGIGVVLCIAGIAAGTFVEALPSLFGIAAFEDLMGVVILVMAAIAVPFFIVSGMTMDKWAFMKKTNISLSGEMRTRLYEERNHQYHCFVIKIAVGVSLCIAGAVAATVCGTLPNVSDNIWLSDEMGGAYMLLLIAVAVYLFITGGINKETYDVLLQEAGFSRQKKAQRKWKEDSRVYDIVPSAYWCVVTAGYLAYSFITADWGNSWIVWPVAGCLYGAVEALLPLFHKGENK